MAGLATLESEESSHSEVQVQLRRAVGQEERRHTHSWEHPPTPGIYPYPNQTPALLWNIIDKDVAAAAFGLWSHVPLCSRRSSRPLPSLPPLPQSKPRALPLPLLSCLAMDSSPLSLIGTRVAQGQDCLCLCRPSVPFCLTVILALSLSFASKHACQGLHVYVKAFCGNT